MTEYSSHSNSNTINSAGEVNLISKFIYAVTAFLFRSANYSRGLYINEFSHFDLVNKGTFILF